MCSIIYGVTEDLADGQGFVFWLRQKRGEENKGQGSRWYKLLGFQMNAQHIADIKRYRKNYQMEKKVGEGKGDGGEEGAEESRVSY